MNTDFDKAISKIAKITDDQGADNFKVDHTELWGALSEKTR